MRCGKIKADYLYCTCQNVCLSVSCSELRMGVGVAGHVGVGAEWVLLGSDAYSRWWMEGWGRLCLSDRVKHEIQM